jgi:hypothetical protein
MLVEKRPWLGGGCAITFRQMSRFGRRTDAIFLTTDQDFSTRFPGSIQSTLALSPALWPVPIEIKSESPIPPLGWAKDFDQRAF